MAATAGALPTPVASAQPRTLTPNDTPWVNSAFLTYGTGTEVHVGAITSGSPRLAGVEQAFSGVSINSGGLGTAVTDPETGALVQPVLPGANTSARGSGLEIGAGLAPAVANLLQLGVAQASAPPAGPTVTKVVPPTSVPGVLTTGTLQGSASATYLPQSAGRPKTSVRHGKRDRCGADRQSPPPFPLGHQRERRGIAVPQ